MHAYLSRATWLALLANGSIANGATLFEDGFEQGLTWTVETNQQGRARTTTEHDPATGTSHLVLDDALNDSTTSVAEASFPLDLSFKKNLVLQFKAKSLGNEPHSPPAENFTTFRNYDGAAISTDAGATWRSLQSLAAAGTTWTTYTVPLDAAVSQLGGNFGPNCRIRFSGYDNAPAPLDGIAIDDVTVTADVDQRSIVELPGPVNEGGGTYTGYVVLLFAADAPLTLALSATPGSPLIVPPSVTIPAGATFTSFQYSIEDDSSVTLTRTASVTASSPGITATAGNVTVIDDEVPVVSLTLPASLKEGELPSDNATLSFSPAPSIALTLGLSSTPSGELTLPATLTVPAGQSQLTFTARANNDTAIDGDIPVVATATAPGMTPASTTTVATDNETRALTLTIPTTILEGASPTGTVAVTGTIPDPLVVTLAIENGEGLTVPSTVTIPARSTSATFTITTTDNSVQDGSRTSPLQATAVGFTSATKNVVVKDNEIASYAFTSAFTDLMNLGIPVTVAVRPLDVEGTIIPGLSGSVDLELVLPDGSAQAASPASVNLTNSIWTGSITMPAIDATGLRLRARDAAGNSGISPSFDAIRTLAIKASDLVWDPARNVIYAGVLASDTGIHKNKVIAIDPVTLQITGSVTTNQDPRRMALTPDGQFLYVALYANGTIGKIDPATMTMVSTFPVGSDPSWGMMYADDICTVAGQPDTVILSRGAKSTTGFYGTAVYTNGVQRPQLPAGTNSEIEPSADPTIFFGYNNRDTGHGLSKLQLHANGLTRVTTTSTAIDGFLPDFQSQGDLIFGGNGKVADGSTMQARSTFPTAGIARAEMAASRVYFLEKLSFLSDYSAITVCDPAINAVVRRVSIPPVTDYGVASLIRWGKKGLAFRSDSKVRLVSTSVVSSEAPANLEVELTPPPGPVGTGAPMTYSVVVTNHGPNPAIGAEVTATLSSDQALNGTTASSGTPVAAGLVVKLPLGDLASGASVTLGLTTTPLSAGNPSCQVIATSSAADPDGTNNVDIGFARVSYQSAPETINTLRLVSKSLTYDESRKLFWATVPSSEAPPLGNSVVSIDPRTGAISSPIPLGATPMENAIALSDNGRYLYVGFSDTPQLCRLDLEANPPSIARVPMVTGPSGRGGYVTDIEVLEGDGRKAVVGTTGSSSSMVLVDDLTTTPTNIYGTVIEPTGTPGIIVTSDASNSVYSIHRFRVAPEGLQLLETRSASSIRKMHADGDTLLTSGGTLFDSSHLTPNLKLASSGSPCLDGARGRAYLVNGKSLRSFSTSTGLASASLTLPTSGTDDWSLSCTRWGADGMAILGGDGKIYILRWSEIGSIDEDHDGVADTWENMHFETLDSEPDADADADGLQNLIEYLFGSSPEEASENPLKFSLKEEPDAPAMILEFPRRNNLPRSYQIQTSENLDSWSNAIGVVETVVATQASGDATIDTVRAEIPLPEGHRFARIQWQP
ncbi:hypothetical protein OKA05_12890 [Luteolibacter arcticus]|uniref:DUF11 domain-containing protein n=1 Tax=Luteolibacter arcticus TaxID=1581411 RepID=A0ABT3GIU6_9BACT|nr:hypothetical protein [Luteolibacter arcticus]MCW1923453.1 hypothetical protein [Luteolibacter arcticus]